MEGPRAWIQNLLNKQPLNHESNSDFHKLIQDLGIKSLQALQHAAAGFHFSPSIDTRQSDRQQRRWRRIGFCAWQEVLLTRQQRNKAPAARPAQRKGGCEWGLSLSLNAACDLSHPERRSDKWLIPESPLACCPTIPNRVPPHYLPPCHPTAMTTGGESPPETT